MKKNVKKTDNIDFVKEYLSEEKKSIDDFTENNATNATINPKNNIEIDNTAISTKMINNNEINNNMLNNNNKKKSKNSIKNVNTVINNIKVINNNSNIVINDSVINNSVINVNRNVKNSIEFKNNTKKENEKRACSVKMKLIIQEKTMKLKPRALSLNDLENIEFIDLIKISGDFDFLIHSLKSSKLNEILNNEDISPFIYYGNFSIEDSKEFDIIGEIKELSDSHDCLIDQVTKYVQLMLSLQKSDEVNKRFGFKKENKKIIMYVFDSSFTRYLENILDFKINQKKFTQKKKNLEKYPYYDQIVNSFDNNNVINDNISGENKQKNLLMKLIIKSSLPFIFIFIQNVKKMLDISTDIKTETLEKKENELRKIIEQKEKESKKKELENEKRFADLEALIQKQTLLIKDLQNNPH